MRGLLVGVNAQRFGSFECGCFSRKCVNGTDYCLPAFARSVEGGFPPAENPNVGPTLPLFALHASLLIPCSPRLMKRDLLFVAEQLLLLLDEKRLEMVARNRSIKAKDGESVGKLLTAFIRKADEGTIGKVIIEAVILLSARTQADGGKTLRNAAQVYGVDTDAVALKVKQE